MATVLRVGCLKIWGGNIECNLVGALWRERNDALLSDTAYGVPVPLVVVVLRVYA